MKLYIARPKRQYGNIVYVSFAKPRKYEYPKANEIDFFFGYNPYLTIFPHELPEGLRDIQPGEIKEFKLVP